MNRLKPIVLVAIIAYIYAVYFAPGSRDQFQSRISSYHVFIRHDHQPLEEQNAIQVRAKRLSPIQDDLRPYEVILEKARQQHGHTQFAAEVAAREIDKLKIFRTIAITERDSDLLVSWSHKGGDYIIGGSPPLETMTADEKERWHQTNKVRSEKIKEISRHMRRKYWWSSKMAGEAAIGKIAELDGVYKVSTGGPFGDISVTTRDHGTLLLLFHKH